MSTSPWTGAIAKAEPDMDVDLNVFQEDRKPLIDLSPRASGWVSTATPRVKYSQSPQRFPGAGIALSSSQGGRRDEPMLITSSPEGPRQADLVGTSVSPLHNPRSKLGRNGTSSDCDITLPSQAKSSAKRKPLKLSTQNRQTTRHTLTTPIKQEFATDNATPAFGQAMSGPSSRPAKANTTPAAPETTAATTATEPQLSAEQQAVLAHVKRGESIFFTGSAGVGKSVLTRAIIRELRIKYGGQNRAVAVTATTGIAACNIEGTTLHSWAGIGLGKEEAKKIAWGIIGKAKAAEGRYQQTRSPNQTAARWRDCRALIIDEISMLDGRLFDVSDGNLCLSTILTVWPSRNLKK